MMMQRFASNTLWRRTTSSTTRNDRHRCYSSNYSTVKSAQQQHHQQQQQQQTIWAKRTRLQPQASFKRHPSSTSSSYCRHFASIPLEHDDIEVFSSNAENHSRPNLEVICERAREMTRITIEAPPLTNVTDSNDNDAEQMKIYKQSCTSAIEMAEELIHMTSNLPTPLPQKTSQHYSTLHKSFVSITHRLLHLATATATATATPFDNFDAKHNTSSSSLQLQENYSKDCLETILELVPHASFLQLPLHLPLYKELFPHIVPMVPLGQSTSTVLQLCSTLQQSFPWFQDWESLLVPIMKQMLEHYCPPSLSNNHHDNDIDKDDHYSNIGLVCKEIHMLLQVTQSEYSWELHWENAFMLLQLLKSYPKSPSSSPQPSPLQEEYQSQPQLQPHPQSQSHPQLQSPSRSQLDLHLAHKNSSNNNDIYVMELTKTLSEPMEQMLKNKKYVLKQLSQDVHTMVSALLKHKQGDENNNNNDNSAMNEIPAEELQMLLDRLIFQDGKYDDNDDDDIDDDTNDEEDSDSDTEDYQEENDNEMNLEDATEHSSKILPTPPIPSPIVSPTESITTTHTTTHSHTQKSFQERIKSYHHEMIYYRDDLNQDWAIPDVTQQFLLWNNNTNTNTNTTQNGNQPLRFTDQYEDELIRQIAEEGGVDTYSDYEEEDDDDMDEDDEFVIDDDFEDK